MFLLNASAMFGIGNSIGDEGVKALSDALKVNTTLNTMSLRC